MIQVIAILCLAVYGAMISLLVGLKHEIAGRMNISDARAGMLFSGFMLAGAIGVVLLSSLIDVLGQRTVAIFGFFFTAAALAGLSLCRKYAQVLAAYIILSAGAMCIISVGNTILPLVLFGGGNASAATNLGNAFYGVGAFLVSYYLTGLLARMGYRRTVGMFALLVLAVAVLSLAAEFPAVEGDFRWADVPGVLTSSVFVVALVTNFFGAGVENGVGSWANTYMARLGSTDRQANRVLSLFFIAILAARLITSLFVTPSNTPLVLAVLAVSALAVLVVLRLTSSRRLAAAGLVTLGLLMGSVCPNIFGYMFSKVDPSYHGTAFGVIFAVGLAGSSVLPALIGVVSKRSSLRTAFTVNMAGAALFGVCALVMMSM